MRLTIKLLSLIILSAMLFYSCEDQKLVLSDEEAGFQYYPVDQEKYWIYKVDSTVVSNQGKVKIETSSYVKEEIEMGFINAQGESAYLIQRSVAPSLAGPYKATDRWTIEKTRTALTRFEENLQFVKIIFPIMVGDIWEGNKFDQRTEVLVAQEKMEPYLEWEYSVASKNVSLSINGTDYSKVLEIQEADYETDIERRISTSYYAENVGLISREMLITDSQDGSTIGMPWKERAEAGYWMTQTLIEHN